MKKKFLVAIVVWMFLFIGCSEGHRRHRGHPTARPQWKHRSSPGCYRGPIMRRGGYGGYKHKVEGRGSYGGQRGSYGTRR